MNILETIKSYLTPATLSNLAGMLQENESGVSKAMNGSLPSILAALLQKASSEGGAATLLSTLKEGNFDGSLLDNFSGVLGDSSATGSLLEMGRNLLGSLFGDKSNAITRLIASYSGIREESATSLLSLGTPVVMSAVGKEVADKGLNTDGLMSLLLSQKENIASIAPTGLASILGMSHLSDLGNQITGMFQGATDSVRDLTAGTTKPIHAVADTAPTDTSSESSNWWLWLLGLAILVFGVFYFLRGCNTVPTPTTPATETTIAPAETPVPIAPTPSVRSVTGMDLGTYTDKTLPDNTTLKLPEKGVEMQLLQFIVDTTRQVDKTTWFDFDRLLFNTGEATLKAESEEQLNNVMAILKAFPKVHLKIGGYTDNTGDAEANRKLSEERAKTVMVELVKRGIEGVRLESEGYGDQHPVASNDTDEGKAQNRRVSMRVTQK